MDDGATAERERSGAPEKQVGDLDLHDPTRRLDLAFAALAEVPAGAFATCLTGSGTTPGPTPALLQRLRDVHWLHSDDHPLSFVDPVHHLRVHQTWLRACQGADRIGRSAMLTNRGLRSVDAGPEAPVGWYEVLLVDLSGVNGIDAVVVGLVPTEGDREDAETGSDIEPAPAVSWFRGTTSFRLRIDRRGRIEGGTLNVDEVLGRPLQDLLGTPVIELGHPDDRAAAVAQWTRLTADDTPVGPVRLRIAVGPETWRWFEITSWNMLDVTHFRVVISDFRDVQEQVEAEESREASARAHDRLVRVLDEVDDVVMVGRVDHGLVYLNTAATRLLGLDAVGRPIVEHMRVELREKVHAVIEPMVRRLERWTGELEVFLGDEKRIMATTVNPVLESDPEEISYGVIMHDVTEERAHASALAAQARRDPLTGLPNRLALTEHLDAHRREGAPDGIVSVCFIDLDNLKIVNDGLGHSAGDRLLKAVGTQLLQRHDGIVARFGGDEFVVVLEDASPTAVEATGAAILAAIEAVNVPGINARVTASIGVAACRRDQLDPEVVIRDADAAMYVAKRAGRARIVHFDETMRNVAARRFLLETWLRGALEADGLDIHLQPIVDVASGRVSGFESLARWQHARPDEFIPVAEESGLITPLGRWALRSSLAACARIQALDPAFAELRMGVNVSGHQLLDPGFADLVLAATDEFGIARDHLVLELTESVLIDPREEIDGVLRGLRDAGVSLALDDFGSGYSSLGYLRRYPIDVLKLDNTYTQSLLHDPGTRIIAEGVVTMANRLGLRVVAEGVETPEQYEVVGNLGITWAQGYLLGRPAPLDDIVEGLTASLSD